VKAPQTVEDTTMQTGFADRLRQLRIAARPHPGRARRLVGLHPNLIGRYERGESQPVAETLKRLADTLGVTSDYLLDGTTDQAAKARFEDRQLLEQFQEVERLPDRDKGSSSPSRRLPLQAQRRGHDRQVEAPGGPGRAASLGHYTLGHRRPKTEEVETRCEQDARIWDAGRGTTGSRRTC